MAAGAILDFWELNFDSKMACGVWFLVPVNNFVQIYAIAT